MRADQTPAETAKESTSSDVAQPSDVTLIQTKRREFVAAFRECSTKERELLRALPESGFRIWQAAIRANISKRGVQLMRRRPRFQRALATLNALEDLAMIVANHVVRREYHRIATSSLKDFYDDENKLLPPSQWTPEMGAAVAERSFDANGNPRIKLHDKKGALDALAKINQMVTERVQVTGAVQSVVITTDDPAEAGRQYLRMISGNKPP